MQTSNLSGRAGSATRVEHLYDSALGSFRGVVIVQSCGDADDLWSEVVEYGRRRGVPNEQLDCELRTGWCAGAAPPVTTVGGHVLYRSR